MRDIKITCAAISLLLAAPAIGYEFQAYSGPLPLGNYIADLDQFVEDSLGTNGWILQDQPDENTYVGFLSHRGYDVTVLITIDGQVLTIEHQSTHETECGSNCPDLGDERALGWLVGLRRVFAYTLTQAVRDDAIGAPY